MKKLILIAVVIVGPFLLPDAEIPQGKKVVSCKTVTIEERWGRDGMPEATKGYYPIPVYWVHASDGSRSEVTVDQWVHLSCGDRHTSARWEHYDKSIYATESSIPQE